MFDLEGPMPFIVGVGRSGTTLLRLMLDAHSQLAIPPETGFVPKIAAQREELGADELVDLIVQMHTWRDFHIDPRELRSEVRKLDPFSPAQGVRCFYRLYARRHGKARWGDKTPVYRESLSTIQELLPESVFIHIIRDGRDVALSLRGLWFAPSQDLAELGRAWRDGIQAARRDAGVCRRYREIRFEDLIHAPARVLCSLCHDLELPFEAGMLDYHCRASQRLSEVEDQPQAGGLIVTRQQRLSHHPNLTSPPRRDRIGRWRRELRAEEVLAFESTAGDLLRDLGYESSGGSTRHHPPARRFKPR